MSPKCCSSCHVLLQAEVPRLYAAVGSTSFLHSLISMLSKPVETGCIKRWQKVMKWWFLWVVPNLQAGLRLPATQSLGLPGWPRLPRLPQSNSRRTSTASRYFTLSTRAPSASSNSATDVPLVEEPGHWGSQDPWWVEQHHQGRYQQEHSGNSYSEELRWDSQPPEMKWVRVC